jgi:hypothetical protein
MNIATVAIRHAADPDRRHGLLLFGEMFAHALS